MTTRTKKPKTAPPAPKCDALGIPVQPWAQSAFAATHLFDELTGQIRAAIEQLEGLATSPGGAFLNAAEVKGKLERALADVEKARPRWTDCPQRYDLMNPHPERCRACLNLNWCATLPAYVTVHPDAMASMLLRHRG